MNNAFAKSVVARGALITRGIKLDPETKEERRARKTAWSLRGFRPQASAKPAGIVKIGAYTYTRFSNGQLRMGNRQAANSNL